VSNPAFSREAVSPREAAGLLAANAAAKDHAFWSDELSFAEATALVGVRLVGHQQVTDAYLLGLALRRGGLLATLDEQIAVAYRTKIARVQGSGAGRLAGAQI